MSRDCVPHSRPAAFAGRPETRHSAAPQGSCALSCACLCPLVAPEKGRPQKVCDPSAKAIIVLGCVREGDGLSSGCDARCVHTFPT